MQFEWFQMKYETTPIVSRKIIDMKMSTYHMPGQSGLQADLLHALLSYLIILTTQEEFLFTLCIRGIWGSHRLCHLPKAAILQGTEPGLQATPIGSQNKWWAFNSAPCLLPDTFFICILAVRSTGWATPDSVSKRRTYTYKTCAFHHLDAWWGTTVQ